MRTVEVTITTRQLLIAVEHYPNHREYVAHLFDKKGWVVVKFDELRYFYGPKAVRVSGVVGVALLSK